MSRFDSAIAFLQHRASHLRQSADLEREDANGSKGLAADCDRMADETIAAMRVLADADRALLLTRDELDALDVALRGVQEGELEHVDGRFHARVDAVQLKVHGAMRSGGAS